MANLHETSISKGRKIAGYVLSILATIMLTISSIAKIVGVEAMKENLGKIPNIGDSVLAIGSMELLLLAIYWIPKTSNIGFFLLCSLGGGLIVTEMISGQVPIPGLIITTLIYVGTLLRKPSLSGLGI